MYFWAGLLICLTVGLTAAGVYESWRAGLWGWLAVMLAAELGCFILYFEVVRCWLIWMNLSGDFSSEIDTLEWRCEQERRHDRQGEP